MAPQLSGRHSEVIRNTSSFMLFSAFSFFPLALYLLIFSTFLVFSCCVVLVPVTVRMEVLNTFMSPLKTYPPCGFTRRSVSALPVTPSRLPVITIVTYGSATPSQFTKTGIFIRVWTTAILLAFQMMSIFVRIHANAHLLGLSAYIIAPLYSWYLLILAVAL